MSALYNKLVQSLRWNSFEAILYQTILLSHNLILFRTLKPGLLGIIGTTFSLVYLIISLGNLGLTPSVAPFFSLYTQNKANLKKFFLSQLLLYIAITTLLLLGAYGAHNYLPFFIRARKLLGLNRTRGCIVVALILFEGTKKVLRELLQIAFLSKQTVPLELSSLVLYVCSVWLCYFWCGTIDFYSIFLPMLITSIGNVAALFFYLYRYYLQLPDGQATPLTFELISRIAKNRMATYFNRISGVLFSKNCLIPFFAIHLGLQQAGFLNFICTVSFCVTFIIRHIFGVTGNALLAHLKNKQMEERREQFLTVTRWLTYCLCSIFVFAFINYQKVLYLHTQEYSWKGLYAAYFLLLMGLAESLFITFDTWYTNEEKPHYLLCFNLASIGALYAILHNASQFPFIIMLALLLFVRITTFALVSLFSFRVWRMYPTFNVQPTYVLSVALVSALFYLLF